MNRFRCTDLALVEALPMRFYPKLRTGHVLNNASAKFERHSQHNPKGLMPLGAYSYSHSVFNAGWIGRYCSISENVRVMGASHPHHWVTTSPVQYQPRRRRMFDLPPLPDSARYDGAARPVRIGHDVWIGQDVLLRDGISIGNGAVIAAGSVVTRDVADYMIVGGNPARFIRPRFAPEIATRLLRSAWWESTPETCLLMTLWRFWMGLRQSPPDLKCPMSGAPYGTGRGSHRPKRDDLSCPHHKGHSQVKPK